MLRRSAMYVRFSNEGPVLGSLQKACRADGLRGAKAATLPQRFAVLYRRLFQEQWELEGIVRSFREMSMANPCRFRLLRDRMKKLMFNNTGSCCNWMNRPPTSAAVGANSHPVPGLPGRV